MSINYEPILEESFPTGKISPLLQPTTKAKNKEESNPYAALRAYEQKAVDMRLALLPYSVIQKELKEFYNKDITEVAIRRWFIEGSPCKKALRYREAEVKKEEAELKERAHERLEALAYSAIGMLNKGLDDDSISKRQISIAQDILDRTGFPKTAKLEGKHDIDVHESKQFTDAITAIAEKLKK